MHSDFPTTERISYLRDIPSQKLRDTFLDSFHVQESTKKLATI